VDTHHLHQGEYSISTQESFYDLLKKMQRGQVNTRPVTLLEGWTLAQILSALEHQAWLQGLNNFPTHSLIIKDLVKNYGSAEGWFFPDTYFASRGDGAEQILVSAHHKAQELLSDYWSKRAPDCFWHSPYDALIAASLVERETAYLPERPLIARVIINRLQKGMPLQIDSAVAYGLSHVITNPMDLKKPGPYNTYLNKGLPPSPIAAVSLSSLQAVFYPAISDDFYFVARGHGRHQFSKTFSQHRLAVAYYKKYLAQQLRQQDWENVNQLTGLKQCPILLP
jgi:UPF0755 protein